MCDVRLDLLFLYYVIDVVLVGDECVGVVLFFL